jgi:hypothetical protein
VEEISGSIIQQKENPLTSELKEISEPLGTRKRAPQGRVPFGFQQNPYGRTIDESEMRWIQRIQALASQKFSTEQIARHLNKEDLETKRAGKWSRTVVWRTLQQFKKKAVTKSFRNGDAEDQKSPAKPDARIARIRSSNSSK